MTVWLWYFFSYAFLGWCAEVVFAAFKNGRFVNRGFLNGPVCPIYGFGIVAVLFCLQPFGQNLLLLYVGAVVLITVLELATGFIMEKLFHQRWWDYSKMPLNIGGYVCLPFSLLWGVACVLIVYGFHPVVARFTGLLPQPWSTALLCVFIAVILTDTAVSIAKALKLDQRLSQIDDVAEALRRVSDQLGETIAGGALTLKALDAQARGELQADEEHARNAMREADEKARTELKARYTALVERFERDHRRMLKAFPGLRSPRHPAALAAARRKLDELKNIRKR
ncbi:MAG: hypothetical protein LLF96_02955 [Eubacteriales bacterium]|nr:hypothetical protein [Eubacteriales bacterium]